MLVSKNAGDIVTGNNDGTLIAAGGTTLDRSYGLVADGAGAVGNILPGSVISLTGNGAVGLQAVNGGTINVSAGVVPMFSANALEQVGFQISKPGSVINIAPGTLEVTGNSNTLFRIDAGGQRNFTSSNLLIASGTNSRAIVASFDGTSVSLTGTQIEVSGDKASGLVLYGPSSGTADAATVINISGTGGTGANINATPAQKDGSTVNPGLVNLTSAATVTGSGNGATGYYVTNGGALVHLGTVSLSGAGVRGIEVLGAGANVVHSGTIDLSGTGTGVEIASGGSFENNGVVTVASGIGILVRGAGSTLTGVGTAPVTANDGIAALQVIRSGSVNTAGDFTGNGTAHGVLVDEDAGAVTLGAGTITTGGSGNALENKAGKSNILLNGTTLIANGSGAAVHTGVSIDPASVATLTAAGVNSTGFDFSGLAGAQVTNDLALGTGYTISATGVGATGVRLATTGNATLGGTVNVTDALGGSALVGGPAASITNNGTLASLSTSAPVVDLTGGSLAFTNTGTISAASSTGTAILGGNNGQSVTLASGPVTGAVLLGSGNDTFLMTGGTLAGDFNAGDGDDTATFRGLTDANLSGVTLIDSQGTAAGTDTLTFDATTSTGTRRITGWNTVNLTNGSGLTADGDLTLAGGSVNVDGTSTFFAGNGANPVISAGAGGTLTVNNAGTIDLTNGSSGATDTLTIRGNYIGQNGTLKLQTVLGTDNSPSDRLVIDGGRASGSTVIQITNAGGLGAATTGNGIQVVGAINGATTTATTTKDAFTLAGTHVDAGAFQYRLYASDTTGTDESWYLRTQAGSGQTEVPNPTTPTPPSEPAEVTTYRSEVALLAALPGTLRNADLAMVATYHKRMGDDDGEVAQGFTFPGRLWGRFIAEDGRTRQGGDARPTTDGHMFGGQIGIDLFRYGGPNGHHTFGAYGGYIDTKTRVNGFAGGIENAAVGRLDPTSKYAGIYWTYQANSGFYTDTVVQYSWYGGKAEVVGGGRIGIKGTGVLASVETGYPVALSSNWVLEPQAQLIAQGTNINDVAITNALVTQHTPGNLTGRIGLRLKGRYATSTGSIQPYIRGNVWKGFSSTDSTLFRTAAATTVIQTRNSSLWGEAGAGLTWSLRPGLALYGEGDYRFTLDSGQGVTGHSTGGSVGVKISF